MLEEAEGRRRAAADKYGSMARMLRQYECVYRVVATQLTQRDASYKSYIQSILSQSPDQPLPPLHRILRKQPVDKVVYPSLSHKSLTNPKRYLQNQIDPLYFSEV